MTEASLESLAREHGIATFVAGPVDQDGRWRAKRMGAPELQDGVPVSLGSLLFLVDVANRFYQPAFAQGWGRGLPDRLIVPDADTARILPWEPAAASVICDYADADGILAEDAPRTVLRRVVEGLETAGLSARVAVELEFNLLCETRRSLRAKAFTNLSYVSEPHDYRPYEPFFSFAPVESWVTDLRRYGLPVTVAETEYGAAQFELNLQHAPPLAAADDAIMLKHALRELAARDGMTISFMACIAENRSASSGHVHVSLWDEAGVENAFWDAATPHRPSATMRHFIAGALATLPDFSVFSLPFHNSYKRLLPYSGSPTTATWGPDNRTAALRAILPSAGAARVESRVAGADANPYLTVAATLAGGLYGIERKLSPAEAMEGNLWDESRGTPLPRSLEEATDLLDKSDVAREAFGETFVDLYVASRRAEVELAATKVADWERERYLENV